EHDGFTEDAGSEGGCCARLEVCEYQWKNFAGLEARLSAPLLRAAAGMHQDGTALERGAGLRHCGVPEVSADVVDDLGAGVDCEAGGFGVERVDGDDGIGTGGEDCAEDGK